MGLTHLYPAPEVLADAPLGDIGLTGARVETIRALVCEIPGIGKWTAQYLAMRVLGEPDAFPSSDLGLLRALALGTSLELEQRAEAGRPWRAYAAMYFWRIATQSVPGKRKLVPRKNQKETVDRTGSHQRVSMVRHSLVATTDLDYQALTSWLVRSLIASARTSAVPLKAKISTKLFSPLSMSEGLATMMGR